MGGLPARYRDTGWLVEGFAELSAGVAVLLSAFGVG
jgi:hypothetical protein